MFALANNNQITKWPVSVKEIREAFPSTSFPADISLVNPTDLAGLGVAVIEFVSPPNFDQRSEKVIETSPVNVNGTWQQCWAIQDLSPDEIAQKEQLKAFEMRRERNNLLASCDWTQLADSNVDKDAWAAYRQSLRDLPQSKGFPWECEWSYAPDHYFSPDNH
jgi:hypothetical protein